MFELAASLCFILFIYYTVKTLQKNSVISLQIILTAGVSLLFINSLVYGTTWDSKDGFNVSLLYGVIGVWIGCMLFPVRNQTFGVYFLRNKKSNVNSINIIRPKVLNIATGVYISYVVYTLLSVVSLNGINSVFSGGRSSLLGYDNGINSSTILLFTIIFELLLYINVARLYKSNHNFVSFILFLFPIFYLFLTAQTRFDIIAKLVSYILFIVEYKNSIKIKPRLFSVKYLGIFILLFGFSIFFMSAANAWRNGYGFTIENLGSATILMVFMNTFPSTGAYFDYYHSLYYAINTKMANLEYGANWVFYNILNFIPRSIWTNKPITSINGRFTELLYPEETAMCTFTIFGEGYAQFGNFGVLIESTIVLLSKVLVLVPISRIKDTELFRIVFITNLLTYTRSNAPIFECLCYLISIYIIKHFLSHKVIS